MRSAPAVALAAPGVGWEPPPRPRVLALGIAATITTVLAVLMVVASSPAHRRERHAAPLVVVAVRGDPVRPPPPPALPPFVPVRVAVAPPTVPPPVIRIATAPPPPAAVARRAFAPAASRPAPPRPAPPTPVVNARPPPAPPVAPGDPHAVDTLEGRIRRAVQAALRYPASARDMGEQGRALVGFDYRDRSVSNVRLLVGSGDDQLDHAALATVREADYPPPGALAGRTLALAVWVSFRLGGGDDG